MGDVQERIDELFRRPPGEFVAARDALAKELRAHDRAASDEVKALRKPTVAAHGLNLAARDDPDGVQELWAAGLAVQAAQEAALAGDRATLREATERRRAAIARLADTAVGHAGEGHRDEIEATLDAASVEPDLHQQLAAGRLQATSDARAGFGGLAGLLSAGDDKSVQRRRAEAERLRARVADAESDVEHLAGEVERAEERLATAQHALDEARRRLEDASARRDEIAAQLADADAP